jgi:acetyl esterase/lipase
MWIPMVPVARLLAARCGLHWSAAMLAIACLAWQPVAAQSLRERLLERRAQQLNGDMLEGETQAEQAGALPAGVRLLSDLAYGSAPEQRMDVYLPAQARGAPVIFMVHGGGWRAGSKSERAVVANKVAHWVPKGFILVSVNYRLLPQATPLEQAADVARALAAAQDKAASWGGERRLFMLMGHSAGAHLVALLATQPSLAAAQAVTPWLGTVALDSAAFDVTQIMQGRHFGLYDKAFGRDPAYWKDASPYYAISKPARPLLAVCSSRRAESCAQAQRFAAKANPLGMPVSVLPMDLSHREINLRLGEEPAYTAQVETFMASLDSAVAALLAGAPKR